MSRRGIAAELLTRHSSHPLLWFSVYHHSLHNLLFASIVASLAFLLATRRWLTAGCAFLAFHLHLLEDLLGSRGPDGFPWPIPYLQPFTARWTWAWDGQWALNAWPNFTLTIVLLLVTLWLTVSRGRSPVWLFFPSADRAVVSTVRRRFAMLSS